MSRSVEIHPTAMVDPRAELGPGVKVGPWAIIGPQVTIGADTWVGPHVVIEGPTEIGCRCRIHPFAVLGTPPQDLKYRGEPTWLRIGDDNVIREFVTVNRGTEHGGGQTVIGNGNLLMAYCHVAHDCRIGNGVIMANVATLGGHIEVEDHAIIGGLAAVHQFVRIGTHCLVGGASAVSQDVPPYGLVAGNRAKLYGLNVVGLRRRGFPEETIAALRQAYRLLFRSGSLRRALAEVRQRWSDCPEVQHLVEFVERSKRGITR